MKTITKDTLKTIEVALDIKLYEAQKVYLLEGRNIFERDENGRLKRQQGITLAYCISLALSDEPIIYMRTADEVRRYQDGIHRDYERFFRKYFYEVWSKLKNAGLDVVKVRFK